MASKIDFRLSVCQDRAELVLNGNKYLGGHRGSIQVEHSIEENVLKMNLAELGHHPQVGGADRIIAVSIRVCEKSVSTIAIYDDLKMNVDGCCYTDPVKGCSVYGDWGCSC